ncbi:MAG: hypothetical protein ABJO36_08305 [Litorimonas sp.]
MGQTFTLITAVLMTMAALTWVASALMVGTAEGAGLTRWFIVAAFAVMAAIYWRLYFKRKSAENSGTE